MFENLLEQPAVKGRLKNDIKTSSLPSSILFYGPSYSGKMTAALELARTLTCSTKDAPWNCNCRSCNNHRLMDHPFTLITGGRYFYEEIAASADLLEKKDDLVSRYMFVRNVRKLLKRFDSVLWEGETAKLKKCQSQLNSVIDKIENFLPGVELPEKKKRKKLVDDLLADCKKLSLAVPSSTPINQIRKISTWAHRAGDKKVVILENADHMQDGARNALLKILEEPPSNLQFILVTTRIGAILPTIKSRVRAYGFAGRNENQSQLVLQRIFKVEDSRFHSLREFFLSYHNVNSSELRTMAELFLSSVNQKEILFQEVITSKFEKEMFIPFLEELTILLNKLLKESLSDGINTVVTGNLSKWNKKIRDYSQKFEILNQNHTLLLESLYYDMKG
jgi:DNA polymerase-3 subunit gamma/tau